MDQQLQPSIKTQTKQSADCDKSSADDDDTGKSNQMKIPTTTAKKLRFFSKTSIYLIRTLDEYTDDEIASYWRGDEDQSVSQADLLKTIKLARHHTSLSDEQQEQVDISFRGIEHMCCPEKMKRRKVTKKHHIDAVLDEQDAQWDENVLDEEAIRATSLQHSQNHRDEAISRASQDAAYLMRQLMFTR